MYVLKFPHFNVQITRFFVYIVSSCMFIAYFAYTHPAFMCVCCSIYPNFKHNMHFLTKSALLYKNKEVVAREKHSS